MPVGMCGIIYDLRVRSYPDIPGYVTLLAIVDTGYGAIVVLLVRHPTSEMGIR